MILAWMFLFARGLFSDDDRLLVFVDKIGHSKGVFYLAIYNNAEGYMHPERAFRSCVISAGNSDNQEIGLEKIPEGEYAVVLFLDENGNGRLDKNWLGVPSEKYAFSGARVPAFRAPRWDEAKVVVKGGSRRISVVLR